MNTEQRITYSVAFKGVIRLVTAGEVGFETNDIVAETIELSDAFYDALAIRQGLPALGADDSGKSSKRSRRGSGRRDSSRSGSTDEKKKSIEPKDPNADASKLQLKFLKNLLDDANIEYDGEGFDLDDEEYFFDEFTKGSIQKPLDALR
jgi:hypothetical protein